MEILDKYLRLEKEIHEYFGYVEDWVVIPLDDCRECYWNLMQDSNGGGLVRFAKTMKDFNADGDYYENEIYTQRFLSKWVYRGKDFTMICVDTRVDGNKFLQIFDNSKEIK